jgi:predicted nucleotidyltransferase
MRSTLEWNELQPLLERLRTHYRPEEVWLFGSRARGTGRPDSDWDVLAVVPDDTDPGLFDPLTRWELLRFDQFGADVVMVPRAEFDEDRTVPNSLPYSVVAEGVRLA